MNEIALPEPLHFSPYAIDDSGIQNVWMVCNSRIKNAIAESGRFRVEFAYNEFLIVTFFRNGCRKNGGSTEPSEKGGGNEQG